MQNMMGLSIIDFKTSRSERNDDWNESYYIQASAYAEMFEERTGIPIQQIVILVVTEDGVVQEFIKEKTEYLPMLINAVDDFTTDWEKKMKNWMKVLPLLVLLCSGNAYAEISEEQKRQKKRNVLLGK